MNWDDLRLFLAVAREQSVSGAGKRLGMHHTNVARRMSRFEKDLGTRLFHRSKGGYALTLAGDKLYEHAVGMEDHAQTIERSIAGLDLSLSGSVKFTANQDFFDVLVAPHLKAFHERYPRICLEVLTTRRVLDLDAREADIALRLTFSPDGHLVGRRIAPLTMGIYCSPAYRPRLGDPVNLILFHRQTELPGWALSHFSDAVVSIRVGNLRTARAALRQGFGLANLPCFYGDADPDLRRLDVPMETGYDMWLLHHPDLRTTARVRACREWLVQILNEQLDLIRGQRSRWLEDE